MHVLVTGGAGYIGSVLVRQLLVHEDVGRVTVVDNFMWNQTSLNHLCFDTKLSIVKGDVRDMRIMEPLLRACDVFIPLAALVGAPLCEANQDDAVFINNVAIHQALSHLTPGQRVIYPNTNSGYGIGEQGKFCTEESPLNPISHYGRTKVRAEEIVLSRQNAVVFRLATVFGMSSRMRFDLLVNDFVWKALTDRYVVLFEPHFKRNYIHIRDVARAFVHFSGLFENLRDGVYNVGLSDANLSKAELCQQIKKQVHDFTWLEAPIGEDPDKRDYIVSNKKIEATGFLPRYSLSQGIAELINGYQQFKRYPHGNV